MINRQKVRLCFSKLKSFFSSFWNFTMFTRKIFVIITNLFGLNFYDQKVPLSVVLLVNFCATIFTVVTIFKGMVLLNPQMKGVFFCVDFVQLIMPCIIKNFIMIRAIYMHGFDKKFSDMTLKHYQEPQMRKNEKKFFVYLTACILICAFKSSMGLSWNSHMYNSSQIIPTIFNAASDFLFVYHINCLKDHLKFIGNFTCNVRDEILTSLEILRLIHLRYSINLVLVISTYFLLIIISLYWIFIRIVFGFLNTVHGKVEKNSDLRAQLFGFSS